MRKEGGYVSTLRYLDFFKEIFCCIKFAKNETKWTWKEEREKAKMCIKMFLDVFRKKFIFVKNKFIFE